MRSWRKKIPHNRFCYYTFNKLCSVDISPDWFCFADISPMFRLQNRTAVTGSPKLEYKHYKHLLMLSYNVKLIIRFGHFINIHVFNRYLKGEPIDNSKYWTVPCSCVIVVSKLTHSWIYLFCIFFLVEKFGCCEILNKFWSRTRISEWTNFMEWYKQIYSLLF